MRRTSAIVFLLAALLVCTLIAGTPVNNDPSPSAQTAGIHLTTSPGHASGQHLPVPSVLTILLVAVVLAAGPVGSVRTRRRGGADHALRSLVRSRSGTLRGPPTLTW